MGFGAADSLQATYFAFLPNTTVVFAEWFSPPVMGNEFVILSYSTLLSAYLHVELFVVLSPKDKAMPTFCVPDGYAPAHTATHVASPVVLEEMQVPVVPPGATQSFPIVADEHPWSNGIIHTGAYLSSVAS